MKSLPTSHHVLILQVIHLVKLMLLMPATNAMSERSASAMCRIKTYVPQDNYDTIPTKIHYVIAHT